MTLWPAVTWTKKSLQEAEPRNIYDDLPVRAAEEFFEDLAGTGKVRVERIVSNGHRSPETGWYDQPDVEFVILLKGAARLEFEDGAVAELGPGSWLEIAPHCRHRVAWTQPGIDTVWLAVHYPAQETGVRE